MRAPPEALSAEPRSLPLRARLGSQLWRVLRSTSLRSTLLRAPSATTQPSLHELAQARLGQVLRGKYRLDSVLGAGGMATVYAATHRNRRRFAIKVLHAAFSTSLVVRERFQREGYVTNSVNHPGAVAVFDDDVTEDGSAFLVMELLEGMSVEALWERQGRSLPVQTTLELADQLLDVLAAAHAHDILHRDLKPANLFVTREGTLKVLDFGIARLRDPSAGTVTMTGVALGTPAYMAPEQAFGRGSELDATADVWAVGATMFELLSGQLVFDTDNNQELLLALASSPARPLRSVAPEVPAPVAQLIDRALSVDKHARWPSAVAMRGALRQAHAEVFGTPLVGGPSRRLAELVASDSLPVHDVPRSQRFWRVVWLVLALLLTISVAWMIALQRGG